MLDLRYERQAHIEAPRVLVHDEISDLRQLLTYLPRNSEVTVSADGQFARSCKVVSYGPIRRKLDVTAELTELPGAEGIHVVARVPNLRLNCDVSVQLSVVAARLTVADCEATLTCTHPRADWLRTPVINSLQSHLDGFVATLAARLGQFARAERVFGELHAASR